MALSIHSSIDLCGRWNGLLTARIGDSIEGDRIRIVVVVMLCGGSTVYFSLVAIREIFL